VKNIAVDNNGNIVNIGDKVEIIFGAKGKVTKIFTQGSYTYVRVRNKFGSWTDVHSSKLSKLK
jgi:hypothetical protein